MSGQKYLLHHFIQRFIRQHISGINFLCNITLKLEICYSELNFNYIANYTLKWIVYIYFGNSYCVVLNYVKCNIILYTPNSIACLQRR